MAGRRGAPYFRQYMHFIQHFFQICYIHYQHSEYVSSILTTFEDDALRRLDREGIVQALRVHHEEYRDTHAAFIRELNPNALWNNTSLREPVMLAYKYKYEAMGNLVSDVDQILAEGKTALPVAVPTVSVRQVALGGGPLLNQDNTTSPSEQLGSIFSLDDAITRLETEIEVIGGGWKQAKEALRDLFVSPDVAPYFQLTYRLNCRQFMDFLNSFVRTPLSKVLVGSFLMYCNDAGDLFTINFGKTISAHSKGWELVGEMPVAGTARNGRAVKPNGVDNLEA